MRSSTSAPTQQLGPYLMQTMKNLPALLRANWVAPPGVVATALMPVPAAAEGAIHWQWTCGFCNTKDNPPVPGRFSRYSCNCGKCDAENLFDFRHTRA